MALTKRTYVDGETIITADNLNDIQDEIIANGAAIGAVQGGYAELANNTLRTRAALTANDDADTLSEPGMYYASLNSGAAHLPTTYAGRLLVIKNPSTINSAAQLFFAHNTAIGSKIWYRITTNSGAVSAAWSDWQEVITADGLDDVLEDELTNALIVRQPLTSEDDADTLTEPGVYYVGRNSGAAHLPTTHAGRLLVIKNPNAAYCAAQLFFAYNTVIGAKAWYRISTNVVAAEWSDWFELATMDEMEDATFFITGSKLVLYTMIGGFINLSGDAANLDSPSLNDTWRYAVAPCSAGDVFTVSAHGASNARAYAWLDAEYRILEKAPANAVLDRVLITAPDDAAFLVINTNNADDKSCYGPLLQNSVYSVDASTERGYVLTANGALSNGQQDTWARTIYTYAVHPGAYLDIEFTGDVFEGLQTTFLYCYAGDFSFLERLSSEANPACFKLPSSCQYVKIVTAKKTAAQFRDHTFTMKSNYPIRAVFNPDIKNPTITSSLAFSYEVSRDALASGRLLLPPNYTVDGDKVPLIVFAHGSRGMVSWNSELGWVDGGTDADSYLPLLQYLANEGFAVFDCYPWTNKETIDEKTYSPLCLPVCEAAYMTGIRYVCSRFNIDINKVSIIAKSQGGNIGYWAATQKTFPFRAVCLMATAYDLGYGLFLFNAAERRAVVKYMELDATEEELAVFTAANNGGLDAPEVRSIVGKNRNKFIAMMAWIRGITNGNADDFFNYIMTPRIRTVPTWLVDRGAPSPGATYAPFNAFVNNSEYVKSCDIPVKFWCAFDDTNVGNYANYAIYQYMLNGGSDASWRTLPDGTGAHHAMDTAPEALKSSGTTALGIPYTDIATAYVEAVDFIRSKMGD